jgi:c-di-AMP phosphodiesterase-like protein
VLERARAEDRAFDAALVLHGDDTDEIVQAFFTACALEAEKRKALVDHAEEQYAQVIPGYAVKQQCNNSVTTL